MTGEVSILLSLIPPFKFPDGALVENAFPTNIRSVLQKAVRCPTPPSPTSYLSCLCWRRAWQWVRGQSRGKRWKSGWMWSCSTWGQRGPSLSWGAFTAPTSRANSNVRLTGCLRQRRVKNKVSVQTARSKIESKSTRKRTEREG